MGLSHTFRTTGADTGRRLDQVLAQHVPALSRTKARALLALGGVFVDGHRTKVAGRLMRDGQRIEVHLAAVLERTNDAADGKFSELPAPVYDDAELLVIDKPSGLFSAPTPHSDQNNLLALLEKAFHQSLHLVHRLDRPTSGLMVFAKTPKTAAHLGKLFQDHDLVRQYLAILVGRLTDAVVHVDLPIDGRPAKTRFDLLATKASASLVRAELFTGRTHQVRLHAESLGHPIAGDSKHGRFAQRTSSPRAPRMALHAATLGLRHPSGEELLFHSSLPDLLQRYWDELPP